MEVSSWRYDPWEAWVEMGVQPPTAKIGCTYVVINNFVFPARGLRVALCFQTCPMQTGLPLTCCGARARASANKGANRGNRGNRGANRGANRGKSGKQVRGSVQDGVDQGQT